MSVTILTETGLPAACDTCGRPASSSLVLTVMAGGLPGSKPRYACDEHSPVSMAVPAPAYVGNVGMTPPEHRTVGITPPQAQTIGIYP